MFLRTATHQKVTLELVPSSVAIERGLQGLRNLVEITAKGIEDRVGPLNNAARAFFGFAKAAQLGKTAKAEPPPGVFREKNTGLLRVVHKEIMVRFKRDVSATQQRKILDHAKLAIRSGNRFVKRQFVLIDRSKKRSGAELLDVANALAEIEEVEFATPNFVSEYWRSATPHPEQWHLLNKKTVPGQKAGEDVDAVDAWEVTTGKSEIIVAVLDDGVDVEHPHLKAAIARNPAPTESRDLCGRDFFIPDDEHPEHFNPRPKKFRFPFDQMPGNDIHGTPCAGVIAAQRDGSGASGIAPGCRILPVKIFHADDLASDARVADAIRYAALHASVLSCSWSGPRSSDLELALKDALEFGRGGKGAPVFCATGNESAASVGFPAADRNAIGVGATTDQAKHADYSNRGKEVSVSAPSSGGKIGIFTTDVSLQGRGFNIGVNAAGGANGLNTNDFGGTSSATPLAAGVAALVLSVNDELSGRQVKDLLERTADKIGKGYDSKGHSKKFGFGRVNAAKAVTTAREEK